MYKTCTASQNEEDEINYAKLDIHVLVIIFNAGKQKRKHIRYISNFFVHIDIQNKII